MSLLKICYSKKVFSFIFQTFRISFVLRTLKCSYFIVDVYLFFPHSINVNQFQITCSCLIYCIQIRFVSIDISLCLLNNTFFIFSLQEIKNNRSNSSDDMENDLYYEINGKSKELCLHIYTLKMAE